jgi:hypothetical protein
LLGALLPAFSRLVALLLVLVLVLLLVPAALLLAARALGDLLPHLPHRKPLCLLGQLAVCLGTGVSRHQLGHAPVDLSGDQRRAQHRQ